MDTKFTRLMAKVLSGEVENPYLYYSKKIGELCRPEPSGYNKGEIGDIWEDKIDE